MATMESIADCRQLALPGRRRAIRLVMAWALTGTTTAHGAEAPVLQLTVSNDTYQSYYGPWLELIYREAFRRLGHAIAIVPLPSKRATVMLDAGQVDGVLHRVASYGEGLPHRLMVPEPHFSGTIVAYGLAPVAVAPGWQGLANTRYRVEYRAGSHLAETELKKVVPARQLSSVTSAHFGLRKLAARRIDLYVDVEGVVDMLLATDEFRALGIRPVAVMVHTNAYLYLHSRHAQLVQPLAEALAAMRKEGMIERMRVQALAMPPR